MNVSQGKYAKTKAHIMRMGIELPSIIGTEIPHFFVDL